MGGLSNLSVVLDSVVKLFLSNASPTWCISARAALSYLLLSHVVTHKMRMRKWAQTTFHDNSLSREYYGS